MLGESVLATATVFIVSKDEVGLSAELITVAASGLVLLFALWWLYFLYGLLSERVRGSGDKIPRMTRARTTRKTRIGPVRYLFHRDRVRMMWSATLSTG